MGLKCFNEELNYGEVKFLRALKADTTQHWGGYKWTRTCCFRGNYSDTCICLSGVFVASWSHGSGSWRRFHVKFPQMLLFHLLTLVWMFWWCLRYLFHLGNEVSSGSSFVLLCISVHISMASSWYMVCFCHSPSSSSSFLLSPRKQMAFSVGPFPFHKGPARYS